MIARCSLEVRRPCPHHGTPEYEGEHAPEYDSDKVVWYPPEPCTPLDLDPGQSCDTRFDLDPSMVGDQDYVDVPLPDADLFCSALLNLPPMDNGEIVSPQTAVFGGQPVPASGGNGGNNGVATAVSLREELPFVPPLAPEDAEWIDRAAMQSLRWYPTATTLSDGRAMVSGGLATTIVNGAGDNEEQYSASAEIMSLSAQRTAIDHVAAQARSRRAAAIA